MLVKCYATDMQNSFWTSNVGYNDDPCGFTTDANTITINAEAVSTVSKTVDKLNGNLQNGDLNKWVSNEGSSTVIFKVNNSKGFSLNSHVLILPNLTGNAEYVFSGWFGHKNLTSEFTSNMVTENRALYGILYKASGYTITFDYGYEGSLHDTLKWGQIIKYPTLTREGYTFNGWVPRPERMPAEDTTVVAQWSQDVVSEFVEIVFDVKNMTQEQLKEFIKRYTDEEFEIEEFDMGEETSGVKVIIKFTEAEKAGEFVQNVREASSGAYIKRVGTIKNVSTTSFCPCLLHLLHLWLFLL